MRSLNWKKCRNYPTRGRKYCNFLLKNGIIVMIAWTRYDADKYPRLREKPSGKCRKINDFCKTRPEIKKKEESVKK